MGCGSCMLGVNTFMGYADIDKWPLLVWADFTKIECARRIESPSLSNPKVDCTDLSDTISRKYIPGLGDPGESKVTFKFGSGQVSVLYTIALLRQTYVWGVRFPNGTLAYWPGFISMFPPVAAEYDDKVLEFADMTIQATDTTVWVGAA